MIRPIAFFSSPQMSDFFIEPSWLSAVKGTRFYYPAAYTDHTEALAAFHGVIDEFWFADVNYPAGLRIKPALENVPGFQLIAVERSGAIHARDERRKDASGHEFRFLEPSSLVERYDRKDGRILTVIRRRGYGQIGLMKEFSEKDLGIFMHRGDSGGGGGSGVFFLENRKARYEPCGMLFDKLASRLADESLIVSDGSLCNIGALKLFSYSRGKDVSGEDAFRHHQGREFDFRGFHWSCVGWLGKRYGPTLAWGLKRITS